MADLYDLLLSGYIREMQLDLKLLIIPVSIGDLIKIFCTKYIIYGIGLNDNGRLGLRHSQSIRKWKPMHDLQYLLPHIDDIHINGAGIIVRTINNEIYITGNNERDQLGRIKMQNKMYISEFTQIPFKQGIPMLFSKGLLNKNFSYLYTINHQLYGTGTHSLFKGFTSLYFKDWGFDERTHCQINTDFIQNTLDDIVDIRCSAFCSFFLTKNGHIYACDTYKGYNDSVKIQRMPTDDNKPITKIECGDEHNLCITKDKELMIFGCNRFGQLGVRPYIVRVTRPKIHEYFKKNGIEIKDIKCGRQHSLVFSTDNRCYVFGANKCGQCSLPRSIQRRYKPHLVSFVDIEQDGYMDGSCGCFHNVLLTSNNKLVVFGLNEDHQCSSLNKQREIFMPYIVDKGNELEIEENAYIEKVLTTGYDTIIIIDPNRKMRARTYGLEPIIVYTNNGIGNECNNIERRLIFEMKEDDEIKTEHVTMYSDDIGFDDFPQILGRVGSGGKSAWNNFDLFIGAQWNGLLTENDGIMSTQQNDIFTFNHELIWRKQEEEITKTDVNIEYDVENTKSTENDTSNEWSFLNWMNND